MGTRLGALLAIIAFMMYLFVYLVMVLMESAGAGRALSPETVMWRGFIIMVVFWIVGRIVGSVAGKLFTEVEAERSIRRNIFEAEMWLPEHAKKARALVEAEIQKETEKEEESEETLE